MAESKLENPGNGRLVFVSYTHHDEDWAKWIAEELTALGYACFLQASDIRPGQDFVHEMQAALQSFYSLVAILSPDYLRFSPFGEAEWRTAFAADPSGELRRLIPVKVRECRPSGLLLTRVYVDLVGVSEDDARQRLRTAFGATSRADDVRTPYPGAV